MTQPRTPRHGHGHQPYGPPPPQPHQPLPRPRPEAQPPYGPRPQRPYPRPPQQTRPAARRPDHGRRQAYEPPAQRSYEPAPQPSHRRPEPPAQRSYEPAPQPSHRRPEPRNGLGLAAAIIGPIGVLFGLVPLTGFVAVICGLVAVPLALAGRSRYKKRLATNGRTAVAGLVSGVVALALGVWGIVIVFQATNELVSTLEGPSVASTGPVGGGGGATGQASTGVAAFGQRVTYDDGVAVEVTPPQAFTPSRYAFGNERDRAVSFEVTVINGSDQPLDTVTAIVRATHAGRDAPLIFDSEKGMGGAPQGTVLPGKSITFPVAVSIGAEAGDLQIDVTPGIVGDPAIFSGQVQAR
jgi:hypothetical protein